ncbi:PhzF family phenazine biosynthesis protein [Catenuloplanes japonicus]|uniref:PhzF family phenazine biosynthesis protein n=1 Tax=Catenuloplanes japonicus TaxID=33876 RepID=UPI0005279292|nr:PhzF family phenazine biosynthesis protein [Catenuloplanes japonicus]
MTTVTYEIVDVFTDRPFAGNPLAVVFGAEALGGDQMQTLAREFNLSETVFVLPPSVPDATYRARIFTPVTELPFAGHPSVGAAVTVVRRGDAKPGTIRQECGAGVLPIEVTAHGEARLTGGTPTLGAPQDPAPLLEIAGLTAADLDGPPPRTAGCGLEHLFLSVRPDAVSRARPDAAAAARHGVRKLTVLAWDADARAAHLRMFAPGVGVTEDPATGSAALGLGVWLVASGLLPADGEAAYMVHQGAEIHRPSTLDCTVTAASGAALSATVAGHVVKIARGEIAVPPFIG